MFFRRKRKEKHQEEAMRDALASPEGIAALWESRGRYKDLVEITSDFAWEVDAEGRFIFVSPQGALGYKAADLVGQDVASFCADPDEAQFRAVFLPKDQKKQAETWFRRQDNQVAILRCTAIPLYDEAGAYKGARGIARDMTESYAREEKLAFLQQQEQLILYITRAMRNELNPQKMLEIAAQKLAQAFQMPHVSLYRPHQGAWQNIGQFGDDMKWDLPDLETPLEDVLIEESGEEVVILAPTFYHYQNNGLLALAGNGHHFDESQQHLLAWLLPQLSIAIEQLNQHELLENLSRFDSLTGLLNRRSFWLLVEEKLERGEVPAALAYVDLDHFKAVNDHFGHQKGDEALKAVTKILETSCAEDDLLARLGGDEFAIWFVDGNEKTIRTRIEALLARQEKLSAFSAGKETPLGFSIGAVMVTKNLPLADLIHQADQLMYEVKKSGKGNYRLVTGSTDSQ